MPSLQHIVPSCYQNWKKKLLQMRNQRQQQHATQMTHHDRFDDSHENFLGAWYTTKKNPNTLINNTVTLVIALKQPFEMYRTT